MIMLCLDGLNHSVSPDDHFCEKGHWGELWGSVAWTLFYAL